MSTLLKLERKPAGAKWREDLLKKITAELDAGRIVTIDVQTPTMTPQQVARELGLSRTTVLRRIEAGELRASKRGNRNVIAVADFKEFRASYIGELGAAFADDF
ncbi:helix-turn-helix domain-containing protein [Microbacterium sp. K24]|uniref:helix-turn-helix domain-containing protein n=1 Tax=Microbacterium sp. K24 TaxID=2305446 RepID=UPI001443EEDC|nr:helix-turn-helix domain-containing protein [Microbacterium sp. K24]